jgi:alginate O-acetyltransferase complex protein AlgJ
MVGKFILRFMLFLSPFLLALGIEVFILPVDFFTFRVWEALRVRKFELLLPGPFYPDTRVSKEEEGDLAHHTPYAVKRKVVWVTDAHGYRNEDSGRFPYEIVIVGESEIVGNGLTQDEMLSEVLETRMNTGVYALAPGSMNSFLRQRRFAEHPPRVLILARPERLIAELPPIRSRLIRTHGSPGGRVLEVWNRLKGQIEATRLIQKLGVVLDRIYKGPMLHSLRAKLRRDLSVSTGRALKSAATPYGLIFFLQGRQVESEVSPSLFDDTLRTLKSYRDLLQDRNIRFIFLPIPEKETLFYEYLGLKKPQFLSRLNLRLQEMGIETIDLESAFGEALQQRSILPYQRDDTHWSAEGVRITVELIETRLRKKD